MVSDQASLRAEPHHMLPKKQARFESMLTCHEKCSAPFERTTKTLPDVAMSECTRTNSLLSGLEVHLTTPLYRHVKTGRRLRKKDTSPSLSHADFVAVEA